MIDQPSNFKWFAGEWAMEWSVLIARAQWFAYSVIPAHGLVN